MTETRCPHASQRETWPNRLVPVPPPWGWVQSRSVSTRMCTGRKPRRWVSSIADGRARSLRAPHHLRPLDRRWDPERGGFVKGWLEARDIDVDTALNNG